MKKIKIMKRRKIKAVSSYNIVGFSLTMIAGWIDAIGLRIFFSERSSSMTGRAAALASSIVAGDWFRVMKLVIIILSFIVGAVIGTGQTRRKGLSRGLFTSAILLLLITLALIFEKESVGANMSAYYLILALTPMALGCMNASTSLTPLSRTTHLTGLTTELGICIQKRDWYGVFSYTIRWVAFLSGAISSMLISGYSMPLFLTYLIPCLAIASIGLIQKKFVRIPLTSSLGLVIENK